MISTFPVDFSMGTYDILTADGKQWHFTLDSEGHALVSGDLRQPVLTFQGRPTFFAPDYRNINVRGFVIAETEYIPVGVVPNDTWAEPVPDPSPLAALYAKERTFAALLLQYATAFSVDLKALSDINISTMLQAAREAGATEEAIALATTMLLAAKADIEAEAEVNKTWAKCWQELKGRLPGYFAELQSL